MTTTQIRQGDPALLDTDLARRLLASRELARLAYTAADGTPRVFPMLFHWNGQEIVFSTFAGTAKVAGIKARPDVAVTIDTAGPPPDVLLMRGRAEVTEIDGVVPEYLLAQERYYGAEAAQAAVPDSDGVRMVRMAVRPTWVGTMDFTTRFPGGHSPEEFAQRGRS